MKTRLLCVWLSVATLGLAGFNVAGCTKSQPRSESPQTMQYTCPMHPEVLKDVPGQCPRCGMKLVTKP